MAKITLYHGTSEESYLSILQHGFNPSLAEEQTWTCSDSDKTYFYNPSLFVEHDGREEGEDANSAAIDSAFENAKLSAAYQRSRGTHVYVIAVTVDESDVESDDSCGRERMQTACAVDNDRLSSAQIVAVYQADFLPNMSLVYIAGAYDMDYMDSDHFTEAERDMIKIIGKSDLLSRDDFIITQWEQIEITN